MSTLLSDSPVVRTAEAAGGIIIQLREDGSKMQKNPDGRTIETLKDGTKKQCDADGGGITKYPDGREQQLMPDGTVIDVNTDGTRQQTNPDGNVIEILADGTFLEMGSKAELEAKKATLRPAPMVGGTLNSEAPGDQKKEKKSSWWPFGGKSEKEQKAEDEMRAHELNIDDGRTSITFASGITQTKWPDGKVEQINPDGTLITIMPDKTRIQTTPDGVVMTVMPNGQITQTDPNGKYIVSHVDAQNPNGVALASAVPITFTHKMTQDRRKDAVESNSSHVIEGEAKDRTKFVGVSGVGKQKNDAGVIANIELDRMNATQLRNLGAQYGLTAEDTIHDNEHIIRKKIKMKMKEQNAPAPLITPSYNLGGSENTPDQEEQKEDLDDVDAGTEGQKAGPAKTVKLLDDDDDDPEPVEKGFFTAWGVKKTDKKGDAWAMVGMQEKEEKHNPYAAGARNEKPTPYQEEMMRLNGQHDWKDVNRDAYAYNKSGGTCVIASQDDEDIADRTRPQQEGGRNLMGHKVTTMDDYLNEEERIRQAEEERAIFSKTNMNVVTDGISDAFKDVGNAIGSLRSKKKDKEEAGGSGERASGSGERASGSKEPTEVPLNDGKRDSESDIPKKHGRGKSFTDKMSGVWSNSMSGNNEQHAPLMSYNDQMRIAAETEREREKANQVNDNTPKLAIHTDHGREEYARRKPMHKKKKSFIDLFMGTKDKDDEDISDEDDNSAAPEIYAYGQSGMGSVLQKYRGNESKAFGLSKEEHQKIASKSNIVVTDEQLMEAMNQADIDGKQKAPPGERSSRADTGARAKAQAVEIMQPIELMQPMEPMQPLDSAAENPPARPQRGDATPSATS